MGNLIVNLVNIAVYYRGENSLKHNDRLRMVWIDFNC
ncbi:MAG: hypothetical protein ACJASQ_001765 [Crocinitomicaceae bacterium]|jgi:hypothetical protein